MDYMEEMQTFLFIDNKSITDDRIYTLCGFKKRYLDNATVREYKNEYLIGDKAKKLSPQIKVETFADFVSVFYDGYVDDAGVFKWENKTWDMTDIDRDMNTIVKSPLFYDKIIINGSFKPADRYSEDEISKMFSDSSLHFASAAMEKF